MTSKCSFKGNKIAKEREIRDRFWVDFLCWRKFARQKFFWPPKSYENEKQRLLLNSKGIIHKQDACYMSIAIGFLNN
jgi:hypothetical protein